MIRDAIRSGLRRLGYDLVLFNRSEAERDYLELFERVKPFTITSYERVYGLVDATRYVVRNRIPGAFVECGVFKGGSMMAIALALLAEGVDDRELYLYDTFAGMPAPGERDVDLWGKRARELFPRNPESDVGSTLLNCSQAAVAAAMASTGYPADRVHFVKGLVEETLPGRAPASIALMRLDTDWYRSTLHELVHLYPRLSPRGVAIIDDYGHFAGAREATDEFFRTQGHSPFLHRLDYTGRLLIKDV